MKILILHTSLGHGHKTIAENIGNVLREDHDVELRDILEVERGRLVDWGSRIYLRIILSFPWLWEFFYTSKVFLKLTLPFRTIVGGWRSKRLAGILAANSYDMVISTQVTSSSVVSYLKKKRKFFGKFAVAFSDYHLHPYWVFDNVDLYLANIPEQKEEMVKMGISAEKIAVCGMTLQPKKQFNETAVRNKFNVKPQDKVVLFMGGGKGMRINPSLIREIEDVDAKIFVLCGENKSLQSRLAQRFASKENIRVMGFVSPVAELYSISDLVMTKPGGLTVAECLDYALPILVTDALPGQEVLNNEWLSYHDLVFPEFLDLKGAVEDELATQTFRNDLRKNPALALVVQHGEAIKEAVNNL